MPFESTLLRLENRLSALLSFVFAALLFGVPLGASGQSVVGLVQEAIPMQGSVDSLSIEVRHDAFWLSASARRALEAGLYDLALVLSDEALALFDGDASAGVVELLAIDALLAREDWIEATRRLESLAGYESVSLSSIALRRAMIAYAEESVEKVDGELAFASSDRLSEADVPWFWFLKGWALQRSGKTGFSSLFVQAHSGALKRSPALAAQLGYLIFKSELSAQTMGSETIAQLQNALLENEGREIGYAYAQQLAVSLFDLGEREEAIALIERQLARMPLELGLERAQFLLLQSMAAGLEEASGRQALQLLLEDNSYPGLMSIALQQAFRAARSGTLADSGFLRDTLDRLISRADTHELLDQALYYRSVFKFLGNDFVGAEKDASVFQDRFPNSPYRRGVLALQASSAWNRSRFRTAASYLQRLKMDFPDLGDSSTLSALTADCYLRAGLQSNTVEDFRNAADAYATALKDVEVAGQGGPIFYQLVLARIRSRQLEMALEVLENASLRAIAGGEMVWRSEWMVIKELRRLNRIVDAYDRIELVVGRTVSDPLLRLRLLWLAVKLSIESGNAEDAEYWVDQVNGFIDESSEGSLGAEVVSKVRASCLFSLAESKRALGEAEEAVVLLEELRDQYSGYESALLSYIAQARYYSSINRTVEAQQLLVSLADEYPEHRLAPVALFEAAQNAERRGEDAFLDQANKLLERIATDYPDSEIVYYARLKQADLLRKLNKFGSAERIYAFLESEYSNRPDRYLTQLSLADTLLAQSNENPSKFDAAVSRLELLMDLPEAPFDLRVEAGYKLGQAWRIRGERLKAKQIFWLFYDLSIVEKPRIRRLSREGLYWLSRCLFALAEISNEEGGLDQAMEFYQQIVDYGLHGAALAGARLDALRFVPEN